MHSAAITADASDILPPLSNAAYDCSAADTASATVLRSTATASETITVAYNPAALETAFSLPNKHCCGLRPLTPASVTTTTAVVTINRAE